jgi:hypothetical protein
MVNRRLFAKQAHQHRGYCLEKGHFCFCFDREAQECAQCRHVTFRKYVDSLTSEQLIEHRA